MSLVFANPAEWWIEKLPDIQPQCWHESQALAGHCVTTLSPWFQGLFANEWRSLDTFGCLTPPALARSTRPTQAKTGFCVPCVKFVTLTTGLETQTVALLMALNSEADGRMGVRVQVHPASNDGYLPPQLSLAIYSANNEVLQIIQAREQEDYMRLPHFKCLPGTQFRLQITLTDDIFCETFTV